jgi:4Fe-4S ferredoxin
MPMKLLKTEDEKVLQIERILYARSYSLTLHKNLCKGCGICVEICPREAIELKKIPKAEGEKARVPSIDIDEKRCIYCGICSSLCLFGALELKVDGKTFAPLVETGSFPQLIRDIEFNAEKCEVSCVLSVATCMKQCPLDLIKVTTENPCDHKNVNARSGSKSKSSTIIMNIDKDRCPSCRICAVMCPYDALSVNKTFQGAIKVNTDKCPKGCRDCLDVCPISGVLYLSEDNKVKVNQSYCIYCGVCKRVCPVEGALKLQRTLIRHTPVRSGAWNKALEKLTSTEEMNKELRAKSLAKTRESVGKRLVWRRSLQE